MTAQRSGIQYRAIGRKGWYANGVGPYATQGEAEQALQNRPQSNIRAPYYVALLASRKFNDHK